MATEFDCDYLVVGSGFGGSVASLRLVEKGYDVVLLEKGRRLGSDDFPRTNWNLKRWLWAPLLGFRGLFQMRFFRHVTVLAGAGVGGGSLTYANTLPIPKDSFFDSPGWASLASWKRELAPHYKTASRMLGRTQVPFLTPPDRVLQRVARKRGMESAFEPTEVGVYFGTPGEKAADPYFDGEGPERTGCNHCGACMTGCRHGAKNTLDKNYLHLAEKLGLRIRAGREVTHVAPLPGGGYAVRATSEGDSKETVLRVRRVVFSAGALGTNALLLKLKDDPGGLPELSERLGCQVRTNSESLIFVTVKDRSEDWSRGVAIGSILQLSDTSHLEVVRYGSGSGFFRAMQMPHVRGQAFGPFRIFQALLTCLLNPLRTLRALFVRDWAKHTMILLYMKCAEGTLRFRRGRSVLTGFRQGVVSTLESGEAPQASIPEASELAQAICDETEAVPFSGFSETLFSVPTTAHILGGVCMGESKQTGVVDSEHRLFGYEGLYVVDGSTMSANPGVNPSLTITAMAERALSKIPVKAKIAAPTELAAE